VGCCICSEVNKNHANQFASPKNGIWSEFWQEMEKGKALVCLFDAFDDMVTELCLYRFGNLTLFQLERTRLKLFHHLSASELAQVAAFLTTGALGDLLCYGAKRFAFRQPFLDGFGFGLGFD
jgi:hypothetical protein